VVANPGPMALWGIIVAGGLVVGSIPALVGLIKRRPEMSYLTWPRFGVGGIRSGFSCCLSVWAAGIWALKSGPEAPLLVIGNVPQNRGGMH